MKLSKPPRRSRAAKKRNRQLREEYDAVTQWAHRVGPPLQSLASLLKEPERSCLAVHAAALRLSPPVRLQLVAGVLVINDIPTEPLCVSHCWLETPTGGRIDLSISQNRYFGAPADAKREYIKPKDIARNRLTLDPGHYESIEAIGAAIRSGDFGPDEHIIQALADDVRAGVTRYHNVDRT